MGGSHCRFHAIRLADDANIMSPPRVETFGRLLSGCTSVLYNNNNNIYYCNWVVTWWQWLFYMYTEYEIGY